MDRQRPRAWSRPWLAMSAAAWLAACQGLPQLSPFERSPEPAATGWRVAERLGDARYLAPGMASWEQIATGSRIPAGSQIATGFGGRLIVHQGANQLSAGTGSRFILPSWEPGDDVKQTAGWLRYRIVDAPATAFGIETPFLDLEVDDAVVDVTVGERETEVAVVSGRVRVKTLDERRQLDLHAGYVGYASLQGDALAVRRGPGQELEPVQPLVLPALHPQRALPAASEPDRAGDGAPAVAAFAGRTIASPAPAAAAPLAPVAPPVEAQGGTPPAVAPTSPSVPGTASADRGGTAEAASPREGAASSPAAVAEAAAPADEIRRRFDALTEGLLDGLPPALPSASRRDAR